MRPKTLAIPSPMEMTVPNSLRSFYILNTCQDMAPNTIKNKWMQTYDLVDGRNLGLEDGNSISDRWFLVSDSGGSEASVCNVKRLLGSLQLGSESGQH
jgi:hypothetical protein